MDCIFCSIAKGEIPATLVFEDQDIVAFKDIRPAAPEHVLIIPRQHISSISHAQDNDALVLGKMIVTAKNLAISMDISDKGYRLVFNVNASGGQEVYHIHLHLLGGRQMTWPPG